MIKTYDELIPFMESVATHTAELYNITDIYQTELLLQKHQWNTERLNNVAIDSPAIIAPFQLMPFANEEAIYCTICGESGVAGLRGTCGHAFCIDCYKGHIKASIDGGPTCIATPCLEYKCCTVIPRNIVRTVLSDDNIYLNKYHEHVVRDFIVNYGKKGIDGNKIHFCINPECNKVAVVPPTVFTAQICCSCGTDLCAFCGKEYHDSCSCENIRKWDIKAADEGATVCWIHLNTKSCPACHVNIEKNQGCNHMTCRKCKHEFCWICFDDWKKQGYSHKCATNANDAPDITTNHTNNMDAIALQHYTQHFERYMEHNKSLKYAKLLPIHNSGGDLYLNIARSTIIQGRHTCKYAYVFTYYNNTSLGPLFKERIATLEQFTDQLQELLENKTQFNAAANDRAYFYDYKKDMDTLDTIIQATKSLEYEIDLYHKMVNSLGDNDEPRAIIALAPPPITTYDDYNYDDDNDDDDYYNYSDDGMD